MIGRRILTAGVVAVITVVSVFGSTWNGRAYAAQTAVVGGNALKVSPVRTDLSLDPGTSQTIQLFVSNLTSVPTTLHAAINDFVASTDETGKPNVILDENQYAPTHSLKQFVAPIKNFTVAPNATVTINATINVPKTAAGGGYFGAIRFQAANPGGEKVLNLSASVGSLILLKVNGEITEKMSLASFDVRHKNKPATMYSSSKELINVIRFQNTGNVQLDPFGKVIVKRFGKQVASYEVNNKAPRGTVLPDSIRRFEVKLDKLSSFGKYTLVGNFGYGTTGQLVTGKVVFYVIPLTLVLLAVGGLVVLLLLIFVLPRMIRSYNRRIIRKASRRR